MQKYGLKAIIAHPMFPVMLRFNINSSLTVQKIYSN